MEEVGRKGARRPLLLFLRIRVFNRVTDHRAASTRILQCGKATFGAMKIDPTGSPSALTAL
jgi:hypothetical protein